MSVFVQNFIPSTWHSPWDVCVCVCVHTATYIYTYMCTYIDIFRHNIYIDIPPFIELCFIVLCIYYIFIHWRFVATLYPARLSVSFSNSIFSLHDLCPTSVITAMFQTFSLLLYLLWWSMISDFWCFYCDSLKAQIVVSIFQQWDIF